MAEEKDPDPDEAPNEELAAEIQSALSDVLEDYCYANDATIKLAIRWLAAQEETPLPEEENGD